MPYKAQCSIGFMRWGSEERTFWRDAGNKTTHRCFSSALWWFLYKPHGKVSFFLMGQPAATGNYFHSSYSRLQSCRSLLRAKLTSNPMNSACRLFPCAGVAAVGPSLSLLPIRFPQWAQTITRSLYPPNTEQIRGLYSPDCRGRRSRGVFLKLQLLPTPDEEK